MHFRKVTIAISGLVLALCGAAAGQTTYVYVGNYSDNSLSAYSVNPVTGLLSPAVGSPFATGTNPGFVSLDRQCRFAYVPNMSSNNVNAYAVDTNTGSLTQVPGSPYAVGSIPAYSAIDRLGKFLFVPNVGLNDAGTTISGFTINGDVGALTAIPGSPFTTGGAGPSSSVVDPSNRFLYVTNDGSGNVSGFTINPSTGALTPISGSPWATGSNPRFVKTDDTGKFLYVANTVSGYVSEFSIDQTTGSLTPIGSAPIGFNIYYIAIDASNKFAYVGQIGGGVYGFSINTTTGQLTPLAGYPVITENPQGNPSLVADPALGFLYVANQNTNTVGVWTVDPNSGALTQIPGSPFPAGNFPSSIGTCTAPDADGADASLIGGNAFSGNQTVNGSVSATSFAGSGAALTGVDAATLGGIAPANYARLDIGNIFNGSQSVTGNLSISGNLGTTGTTTLGGGTPIVEHLSNTFNPSFSTLKPATCTAASFAFAGASDGNTLALGVPNARMTSGVILNYFAWVSSANTITIQECNLGGTPQKTAGSGAIRVDLWKH